MTKAHHTIPSTSHRRNGAVLIVALIITTVLAGMVFVLGRSMRVEVQAAGNEQAAAQAQAAERAAEQYLLGLFVTDPMNVQLLTEDQFQVHVGTQGSGGTFLITRPNYDDQSLPLFGLVEENAKININSASTTLLYNVVQDEDMVSAIDSWRSTNNPDSYYNSLPNPYQCKEAPFESVEELLMVRGFTRDILYGNGTASPLGERTNVLSNTGANAVLSDQQLARGVYDLFTIWGANGQDPSTLPDGSRRYRLDGQNNTRRVLQNLSDQGRSQQILARFPRNNFPQNQNIFQLAARGLMTSAEVDQIADYVRAPQTGPTKIEVNQAPPAVLNALVGVAGIQQSDIDGLLAARQQQSPQPGAIGWVMDSLGPTVAARLGNYISGRSFFYSADIHAYSDNGRGFKRVRIVIDARTTTPEIIYRRDISDRPDPMDQINIDSLRSNQTLSIGAQSAFSSRGGIQ